MDNSKETNNTELLVRRILSEEVTAHREFLERQTKLIVWGLSIIVAIASGLTYFLIGRSYSDIEDKMFRTLDQKVLEYRIDENLKNRLNERVTVILDQPEFVDKLGREVERQSSAYFNQKADQIISTKITDGMNRIDENLKNRLNERVTVILDQPEFVNKLEQEVERQSSAYFNQKAEQIISTKITDEMNRVKGSDIKEIISRSVIRTSDLQMQIKALEYRLEQSIEGVYKTLGGVEVKAHSRK